MRTWLENLQKAEFPRTQPVSTVPQNVPLEFVDLFKVDADDDEDVARVTVSRTLDTDPEISDVPDPFATFLKAEANKKFRIEEPGATHNGLEFEKIGKQIIRRYYEGGQLVKTVITDPDSFPHQTTFSPEDHVMEKSLATILGIEDLRESVAGE